jgi:hypothetical protein
MKTANVTTRTSDNVATVGQPKSSRNRIATLVPEATRQFIISTTGSEVIEPIPDSPFCNSIIDFVKTGSSQQSFNKYPFAGKGIITVVLPRWVNIEAADKKNLQHYVGQMLYHGFREIFLRFMSASIRGYQKTGEQKCKEFCENKKLTIEPEEVFYLLPGEKNYHGRSIIDFCNIYQISDDKEVIKMLQNIWRRSVKKKELNNLPHDAAFEKN